MSFLASKGQLRASLIRWSLFLIPVVLVLGFLSGQFAGSGPDNPWFAALDKPSIYPPPAAFGIVWTILYAMMGFAAALVASAWGARSRALALGIFIVQLVMNLAWSPLFFFYHRIDAALYLLIALDVMVLVTLVLFWKVRKWAGMLLMPYLAWVLFATALNWQFLVLNPTASDAGSTGAVQRIEL